MARRNKGGERQRSGEARKLRAVGGYINRHLVPGVTGVSGFYSTGRVIRTEPDGDGGEREVECAGVLGVHFGGVVGVHPTRGEGFNGLLDTAWDLIQRVKGLKVRRLRRPNADQPEADAATLHCDDAQPVIEAQPSVSAPS